MKNFDNKTKSILYHIQQIRKLLTHLSFSEPELEVFIDHAFYDCTCKPESDQKSNSNPKPQNNYTNPDLTRHYKLDWLFHKPITELVKLPMHDLHKKRERAQLLVDWLGSVMQMKQAGGEKQHG